MTTFTAYQLLEIAINDPDNIIGVPASLNESNYFFSDGSGSGYWTENGTKILAGSYGHGTLQIPLADLGMYAFVHPGGTDFIFIGDDNPFDSGLAYPGVIDSSTVAPASPVIGIVAASASKAEGNSGSTPFTFTVTRSGFFVGTNSATWTVSAGANPAANGADFVGGSFPTGTVTFGAGETTKTVTVNVQGDYNFEQNENFVVTLSNPTAGAIIDSKHPSANGLIINDDQVTGGVAHDTGKSGADKLTNDPTISGSGVPNATVTFTIDGVAVGDTVMADGNGAWSYTPPGLSDGTHTIVATETDGNGGTSSSPTTFTLDATAPNVMVSLKNDAGPSSTDKISNDPTLVGTGDSKAIVHFTVDGNAIATTVTAATNGTWTFLPTGLADGSHTIVASETDAAGNTGMGSITFALDKTAPTITAATTTSSGTIPSGRLVVIDLTTSEAVAVTGTPKLVLSDGGTAFFNSGGDTDATTLEFDYTTAAGQNTADLKISSLTLTSPAKITDIAGNAIVATTAAKDLHLAIDTIAPTVTKTVAAPTSGTFDAGHTIGFTLTMSEATTVGLPGGTPYLLLDDGGHADFVSGSGTTSLLFNYTVGAGETSSALKIVGSSANGGWLTDATGNLADLSKADVTFSGIKIDTTPPVLNSVVASAATVKSGDTLTLTLNFNEAVTITSAPILHLNDGGQATYVSGAGTTALKFAYTPTGTDSTSQLQVQYIDIMSGGQIVDLAGNSPTIPNPTDIVFGTNHVTVVEVPAATAGADGDGTFKAGETVFIKLDFNEAVSVTGAPKLMLSDGGVATFASGSGTDELTFAYTVGANDNANTLKISSVSLPSGSSVTDDATGTHPANFANMANKDLGVVIDTVAPTVTSVTTSPTSVLDNAGKTINFTVNTSEAVNVDITNGKPYLQLDDGEHAVYSGGTGSKALTFQYTVQAGDNAPAGLKVTSLNLGGGAIADLSDNAIDLSKAVTATFSGLHVDTTAPTIIKETASPATGSLKAGTTAKLMVTFSEVVTVSGPNPTLSLNSGMGATATYASGSGTNTLTFNYTVGAHDNVAALAINSIFLPTTRIMDGAGNDANVSNIATTFNGLTIDTTAPTVQGVTATPGSGTQIGLNGTSLINIDMGEALKVSGTPTLTLSDGETATYVAASSNLSTGMLAFSYKAGANHTTGDLQISAVSLGKGAAVTDVAGNAADFTFTGGQADLGLIVDTTPPHVTVASSPASGMRQPLGVTIEIDLQADEAVTVNGVPTITLSDGGTAVYDAGESHLANGVIAFDYTAKAGQNSNNLKVTALTIPSGASIKDLAGNAINASTAANQDVGVIVDTNAPTATAVAVTLPHPGVTTLVHGDTITISVTVKDATAGDAQSIDLGNPPALLLSNGGIAHFDAGDSMAGLGVFTYTVGSEGTTDLKIVGLDPNSGPVTDQAGNPLVFPSSLSDLKLSTNVFTWKGGSGDFDTAANWTPAGGPPANGNAAVIAAAGTYTVASTGDSVGMLSLTGKTATLDVQSGSFAIGNDSTTSTNVGTIQVDSAAQFIIDNMTFANSGNVKVDATSAVTGLVITNPVTLTGGGHITLTSPVFSAVIQALGGATTLTNVDNTIAGGGLIDSGSHLSIVNQVEGVINANATFLQINGSDTLTNAGIVESTSTGGLYIQESTINNTNLIEAVGTGTADTFVKFIGGNITNTGAAATFLASGTNAHIDLQGVALTGGTFKTTGTNAAINFESTDAISGVTNTGVLNIEDHAVLTVTGSVLNNTKTGVINILDAATTSLVIGNDLSLQGGGSINLVGGGVAQIISDSTDDVTLTNVDNTISGPGTIGDSHLTLINQAKGIINGNDANIALMISATGGTMTNAGILKGTAGGGLMIEVDVTNTNLIEALGTGTAAATLTGLNGNITNMGAGAIFASGVNAHVDLAGENVVGGSFKTASGGTIEVVDIATITGVTNTGALLITDMSWLFADGNVLNNSTTGTITIAGVDDTELRIDTTLTLQGGGKVVLAGPNAKITSDGVPLTFTNADNAISGAGTIGDGEITFVNQTKGIVNGNSTATAGLVLDTGPNTIVNQGLFEGTTSFGLEIKSDVSNSNLIEALGANARLALDGEIDNTTKGSIVSSGTGALVTFENGVEMVGGKLTVMTGAGVEFHDGSELASVTNNAVTVSNAGTMTLDDNAQLAIGGTVTLTGKGQFHLNTGSKIFSNGSVAEFINQGNTISGPGTFDDAGLTVDNQSGIISAALLNGIAFNEAMLEGNLFDESVTQKGAGQILAAAGSLINIDGGSGDTAVTGGKLVGAAATSTIEITDHVELFNVAVGNAGEMDIYDGFIGSTGTFANTGYVSIDHAVVEIDGAVTNTGTGAVTIGNGVNGLIELSNGSEALFFGAVSGTGTVQLEGDSFVEFASASTTQNVNFNDKSGVAGSLILDHSLTFKGTIGGLSDSTSGVDFSNFFAFGDSTIDSGWFPTAIANMQTATGDTAKDALISNAHDLGGNGDPVGLGLMGSQILAQNFGYTAVPANTISGGNNYAIAGATSDEDTGGTNENTPAGGNTADPGNFGWGNLNTNHSLASTFQQIQNYLNAPAQSGAADPDALYLIDSGGNDVTFATKVITGANVPQQQAYIIHQADALAEGIKTLSVAGAQHIVVHGQIGQVLGGLYTLFDTELFSKLTTGTNALVKGVDFIESDLSTMVTAIWAAPTKFGFTASTDTQGMAQTTNTASAFIDFDILSINSGWGQWGAPTGIPSDQYAWLRAPNAQYTSLLADDQHFSTQGQQIEADFDLANLFAAGAAAMDSIDLKDINYAFGTTTATFAGTTSGGTLTVTDSVAHKTTVLTLSGGDYTAADFVTADDGQGGTVIIEAAPLKSAHDDVTDSHLLDAHYGGAIVAGMNYAVVDFTLTQAVTLTGDTGGVILSSADDIVTNGKAETLTNNETIHGGGAIGDSFMTFVNSATGTISADDDHNGMLIQAKTFTNAGTIAAVNGGWLDVTSVAGGNAQVGTGGLLEFGNASSAHVTFLDTLGTLKLDVGATAATKFSGTISGFVANNDIDLADINFTTGNGQLSFDTGTHKLTIADGTHTEVLTFTDMTLTLASFKAQEDATHHVDLLHV